jgi:adenylylsulfate kinase
MTKNVQPQIFKATMNDRMKANAHKPLVIWFTGLSGAGKSAIADALEQKLLSERIHTYILDGDNMRNGICSDLNFTNEDRKENIRRAGEIAKLFVDAGTVVITSFISPFEEDRATAKQTIGADYFLEVYVNTSLEICEERDPKGLYKKVRAGGIADFTGISSPYEAPKHADLEIQTRTESVDEAVEKIWKIVQPKIAL